MITIEILLPQSNHPTPQIQTDDKYIEFSKIFTDYIKIIQHQNSHRANSIFTNEVFSSTYS